MLIRSKSNQMSSLSPTSQPKDTPLGIPAMPDGVQLITLDNGLRIIVCEDRSAPVVSAQAWCCAGSIDEGRWVGAGLSHVLEHMLFKGTLTRGAGRIDQEVQDAGGYMNAYTSFDRTVYYINVPNTGSRVAIDILCDIMQNAALPADELTKEMDVIRREMDMCSDDPGRRASRRLFEVAYTRSPYRFTVIGYPEIFSQIQRDDVVGYYREQYVTNNIFFALVGDFRTTEVIEQIRTAFAKAKPRPLPPLATVAEPRQIAPREVIEEAPIELGHVHWSWHIPDVRHPDLPALDVLAVLLGSGRSARLFRQVREQLGLVTSVDAWTYSPGQPGLFGISAVVEAPKFDAARRAILCEVERMKEQLVTPEELGKAVKQFLAATLSTRKTMQGRAQDLGGSWIATGDLNFSERYLASVKKVALHDLQKVARHYLTTENQTLYALLPQGSRDLSTRRSELTLEHPVTKVECANGMRVLLKEDHRLPFVEFRLLLRGGVLAETAADQGLTQLLVRLLMQGTKSRSAEQVASEIESVGGHLETYGGNNSLGVTAEVMSTDFCTGLTLLADVLLNPAFPAEALERERQMQLASIRAQNDQVLQSGFRAMRRAMFGPMGYGLEVLGTEETVQHIGLDHLRRFHRALVTPANAVLAVYGDLTPDAARAAVEAVFAEWQPGAMPPQATPPADLLQNLRVSEVRDKKQAVVVLGFRGTSLYDPDRFPLDILQEACSDLGSRLFMRIRDKLGLAYYVGAQAMFGLVPGFFAFYAGTSPEHAQLVEQELWAEAASLRESGLTAEELQRAKAKIIGQRKIARQDLGAQAQTHAMDELYGLGYAHSDTEDARYEEVTPEQVKAVAAKYLRTDASVTVVVKPNGTTEAAS